MTQNEIGCTDRAACRSYRPGHHVHWIQAKKSWEPGQPEIEVTIVVHDDGRVDLHAEGLDESMWNHDPARLRRAWASYGRAVWKPQFHVLNVPGPFGFAFNLAAAHDSSTCVGR